MRQMVKNVRGNAECVTCHPFAYIKLGGVLDWKLGDGCKTKECRANATVSRWKLERRVLGTGDDFTDMGTAAHSFSASNLWREIDAEARKGWSKDIPKDDRVRLPEAVWFCFQVVIKGKAGPDVGDVLPVLGSLLRACRPGTAAKAGQSFDHGLGFDLDPEAGGLLGLVYAPIQALRQHGAPYQQRCSGARAALGSIAKEIMDLSGRKHVARRKVAGANQPASAVAPVVTTAPAPAVAASTSTNLSLCAHA